MTAVTNGLSLQEFIDRVAPEDTTQIGDNIRCGEYVGKLVEPSPA
ncbi:MAG: hypothetical protein ACYDBM_03725 [Candidatus Tyrphobacter sp.]